MAAEAVLTTLRHVWETLSPLNLPMALMGGLAMSFWRHPRFTKDVDLLVAVGGTTVEQVVERLLAAGIRSKRADPLIRLKDAEFVQLFYEPPESFIDIQVDLLLADSEFQRQALDRRVRVPFDALGFDLCVLACEDLVILKLLAGRVIDRADAAALLRSNSGSLDLSYLSEWIRKLELAGFFAEIWREAFPTEPPPLLT